jgi:hypothetical protein
MQRVHITYIDHSMGSVDFNIRDKKGRAVGYRWAIRRATAVRLPEDYRGSCYVLPNDLPLDHFDVRTTPARDGENYGPSTAHARVATLVEAETVVTKRIAASHKSYARKFR